MIKKTVSKDTPLAEITLRKYEKPSSEMPKRDAIKKLCLSIGLLQPGDSRDIVVDIFHVLHDAKLQLNSEEIQKRVVGYRKKSNLPLQGIAQSNIRRQLRRLRELFLVEKVKNTYRISENENIHNIFEEKIKKFYIPTIVSRVEEYFKHLK
ncbi:hypothetical protein J4216_02950 [Candidatus Woesearchaeota archaeon]|nr:hypothetical protein [Candidatus Woesearchaeota archaeon]